MKLVSSKCLIFEVRKCKRLTFKTAKFKTFQNDSKLGWLKVLSLKVESLKLVIFETGKFKRIMDSFKTATFKNLKLKILIFGIGKLKIQNV